MAKGRSQRFGAASLLRAPNSSPGAKKGLTTCVKSGAPAGVVGRAGATPEDPSPDQWGRGGSRLLGGSGASLGVALSSRGTSSTHQCALACVGAALGSRESNPLWGAVSQILRWARLRNTRCRASDARTQPRLMATSRAGAGCTGRWVWAGAGLHPPLGVGALPWARFVRVRRFGAAARPRPRLRTHPRDDLGLGLHDARP